MNAPLPTNRSETAFEDFKLPLLRDAAIVEANRCLFCHDAPCIKACPTAIDIPQSDTFRSVQRSIEQLQKEMTAAEV